MRQEGRRVAGVRDEENGRDDRKSLVLSPPRLRLPRPAAHTLGTLGSTRLPGSNLFSATKNNVFPHYLLSSPLFSSGFTAPILSVTYSVHLKTHSLTSHPSLWYHFPAASLYFFTSPVPSPWVRLRFLLHSWFVDETPPRVCSFSPSRLHRPMRARPRLLHQKNPCSIPSSSAARCTLSASRRLHELKILDGALAEPIPYPPSWSVRMSTGAWEGKGGGGGSGHTVCFI